ncbi:acyltransferase family protein [Pseudooceanicola marinus]|uniref:acyltransferase family protein n=1 Tax=Pseudooceanicola marinus TaxID=396013 RepID=UPI001CD598FB|nr:acyltransferase [Pseudooceanicola marinus]MCA1338152.1 acyltransferase [Pseudooceanicola marinus]
MLRFTSIESLRAWMAWWVVVGHALHLAGLTPETVSHPILHRLVKLLTGADTAVNVFIMVSGFVICHLLLSKRESYLPYITRRWFRVFPIFAFCVGFALLIQPLYMLTYTQFDWVYAADMRLEREALTQEHFIEHLLLHVTMLHGVLPDTIFPYSSSTLLAPAWSLSLEWQFYLLAPVIIGLLASSRWKIGAGLVLACLVLAYGLGKVDVLDWRYPSFLPLAMPHFLIGIASRMLIEQTRFSRGVFWAMMAVVSIFVADKLAVLVWVLFYPIALSEAGKFRLEGPVLTPLIRLIALNDVVATLGKWSYSTYLVHIPLFALFVGGYTVLTGGLTQTVSWGLILLAMVVAIPVSWLLYEWVERPFIKLGSRVARRYGDSQRQASSAV